MNTENQIRRAAYAVFVKYGFHATTLDMIARKANVNKASIHYYFRSKKNLYKIIIDQIIDNMLNNELSPSEIWFLLTENYNNEQMFLVEVGDDYYKSNIKKHLINHLVIIKKLIIN